MTHASGERLWDGLERFARILSLVAIPVVLGVVGWWIQSGLSARSVNQEYVKLAVSILSGSDRKDEKLREWAVDVLMESSPVKFDKATAQALKSGEVLLPIEQQVLAASSAERVMWGPDANLDPGILVREPRRYFVKWADLEKEITKRVLRRLDQVPPKSEVRIAPGTDNQILEVVAPDGKVIAHVWYGGDPNKNWEWDGLVRVGAFNPPKVWATFQRYSDGVYVLRGEAPSEKKDIRDSSRVDQKKTDTLPR